MFAIIYEKPVQFASGLSSSSAKLAFRGAMFSAVLEL
jgi:hypothetical protein